MRPLNVPDELLVVLLRVFFLVLLYGFLLSVVRLLRTDLVQASIQSEERPLAETSQPVASLIPIGSDASVLEPRSSLKLGPDSLIGRDPACAVVLDHLSVSVRHARISLRNGAWLVEDLDSTNGTLLNNRPLKGEAVIQSGDLVTFGAVRFKFVESR